MQRSTCKCTVLRPMPAGASDTFLHHEVSRAALVAPAGALLLLTLYHSVRVILVQQGGSELQVLVWSGRLRQNDHMLCFGIGCVASCSKQTPESLSSSAESSRFEENGLRTGTANVTNGIRSSGFVESKASFENEQRAPTFTLVESQT